MEESSGRIEAVVVGVDRGNTLWVLMGVDTYSAVCGVFTGLSLLLFVVDLQEIRELQVLLGN